MSRDKRSTFIIFLLQGRITFFPFDMSTGDLYTTIVPNHEAEVLNRKRLFNLIR